MQAFVAMMSHETNTFSNVPTDRAQFEARDLRYGGEIVEHFQGTGTCLGGMIEAAGAGRTRPRAVGRGLRLAGWTRHPARSSTT